MYSIFLPRAAINVRDFVRTRGMRAKLPESLIIGRNMSTNCAEAFWVVVGAFGLLSGNVCE